MIDQYKEILDQKKNDIEIYVSLGPSTITYMGKEKKINEVKKAIKELTEKALKKVLIPKQDRIHHYADQKQTPMKNIQQLVKDYPPLEEHQRFSDLEPIGRI